VLHVCFITYRNGVNVEGATHKQVVDLIRSGGDTLVLTGTYFYMFFFAINTYASGCRYNFHECLAV